MLTDVCYQNTMSITLQECEAFVSYFKTLKNHKSFLLNVYFAFIWIGWIFQMQNMFVIRRSVEFLNLIHCKLCANNIYFYANVQFPKHSYWWYDFYRVIFQALFSFFLYFHSYCHYNDMKKLTHFFFLLRHQFDFIFIAVPRLFNSTRVSIMVLWTIHMFFYGCDA